MNELSVCKRRKAKRVILERSRLAASRHVSDIWSGDFVMDAFANGRRIKWLTVVDDFSGECGGIAIDYDMGGQCLARLLDAVGQFRGYPRGIRTDQGPEFTSRAFMAWGYSCDVKHLIDDAGKPMQNAYIASFNGKFRDECPNEQCFQTLHQARRSPPGGATTRGATAQRDRPHPASTVHSAHRRLAGDAQHQPEIQ
jgi:putative transposase